MKISLILAIEDEDISDVLKTLKNQTVKSFELLVISNKNNSVTENLINMYNRFYDIRYIVASNKASVNDLKNIALAYVNYDIISFLNSKTTYSINVVETCISTLYGKSKTILVLNDDDSEFKKKLNRRNIFDIVNSDNYFVNFEKNDIYLLKNNYEKRANDIEYISNLIKDGFTAYLYKNAKIYSDNSYDKEILDLMRKEIISNNNILLTSKYIKKIFKGVK
ncbi:glycosyltransferase [Oceanivirga miroungae]|uniref:Family 2 glycosyl transferase n=1 Tax=Oceanivirga miroungae TaxID=1130046 RepID=A0A6I8MFI0_9FUSO|nr:glycosyltransferase family A protein [Oceanivirga miroungae]VWL85880.1 family 2 glycosyl transferase [Oceanivirga miroungae]